MLDKLTLKVRTQIHPDSTANDDPNTGERSFGFKVNTILTLNRKVAATLQETYKLEQWVKDSSWKQCRDDDQSDAWEDEEPVDRDWERELTYKELCPIVIF